MSSVGTVLVFGFTYRDMNAKISFLSSILTSKIASMIAFNSTMAIDLTRKSKDSEGS